MGGVAQAQAQAKKRAAASAAVPLAERPVPARLTETEIRARLSGAPKDVRDMTRSQLEAYALRSGCHPRALLLPTERLKQNIMAMLAEAFE